MNWNTFYITVAIVLIVGVVLIFGARPPQEPVPEESPAVQRCRLALALTNRYVGPSSPQLHAEEMAACLSR